MADILWNDGCHSNRSWLKFDWLTQSCLHAKARYFCATNLEIMAEGGGGGGTDLLVKTA